MFAQLMRLGAVTALIAAGSFALPTPAEAAKPHCTIGTWKLTKQEVIQTGITQGDPATGAAEQRRKYKWRTTGGAGTQLKITKSKAFYDFSKSAKEHSTYKVEGEHVQKQWSRFRKQLTIPAKLGGATAHPTLTLTIARATGDATIRSVQTAPRHYDLGTRNIVPRLRIGRSDTQVPTRSKVTCTRKQLTLKANWPFENGTRNHTLSYRRL